MLIGIGDSEHEGYPDVQLERVNNSYMTIHSNISVCIISIDHPSTTITTPILTKTVEKEATTTADGM